MGLSEQVTTGNLELQGISKLYGSVTAVEQLDLSIAAGEFVTLLGASGSGKTTTLAIVAGFQRPTNGRVILDGADITDLPPHRRNIGVVFQHYALFPHLTVRENVAFPLKRRHIRRPEVDRQVDEVLEMVRLEGLAHRYSRELSGGQQQRVALARATVFRPTLLLMDEPLSALDKNLRQNMQTEIRRIHQTLKTTIVYVTHDQEEALSLSDRIVLMHRGRVEQSGCPISIYEDPETAFAARFLGDSNSLRGRVTNILPVGVEVELSDGARVRGRAAYKARIGDEVLVIIRPEDLVINPMETPMRLSAVDMMIEEVIYLGSHLRVRGRFTTGEHCLLSLPRSQLRLVSGLGRLRLAWRDDTARIVPAE